MSWIKKLSRKGSIEDSTVAQNVVLDDDDDDDEPETDLDTSRVFTRKSAIWPIMTAGAGLFSDGYVNNSIGTVNTILGHLYPDEYTNSRAQSNVSAIAFAGTVLGMLIFAYVADYHSRKVGMLASTIILILFTILCSGAWGAGGSIMGLFAAITAYRFFIGIGIGGEYPAGSVACAEATHVMPKGHRNRWFVFFTNYMIDSGFVASAFVPFVLLFIFQCAHIKTADQDAIQNHKIGLTFVWRLTLGLGAIPPLSLFYLRLKFKETKEFGKNALRNNVPYGLIIKFYWWRLLLVSLIWWIYDFSAYSFGLYGSSILSVVIKDNTFLETFGWNILLNVFYLPGSFLGAYASDIIGPKKTLFIGVSMQAVIGYIMAGCYEKLEQHIAAFVVVYGIFLSFGEFGPGDCIGLIASKTSATGIRGQYYGIAAATGKIGAFVGSYLFPIIEKTGGHGDPDSLGGMQAPFWVASSLCVFSAFLVVLLPSLGQDIVGSEDERFRQYLFQNGYDVNSLGLNDAAATTTDEEGNNNNNHGVTTQDLATASSSCDQSFPRLRAKVMSETDSLDPSSRNSIDVSGSK